MRVKAAIVTAFVFLLVGIPACADSFTLTDQATFSGQGFGTLYNLLVLQNKDTETGAVAPSNATMPGFGACVNPCTGNTLLYGDATNSSAVVTIIDLTVGTQNKLGLGMTSSSTFGLLYNVNQEGNGDALNTYLNAPTPFTVYFYGSAGNLLFQASYGSTDNPFPPAEHNGQGTAGYLFTMSGTDFSTNFNDIATIGMSGTVTGSNDGADGWSVVNPGGTNVPEPASMVLLGGGLVALAGCIRRRVK